MLRTFVAAFVAIATIGYALGGLAAHALAPVVSALGQ